MREVNCMPNYITDMPTTDGGPSTKPMEIWQRVMEGQNALTE